MPVLYNLTLQKPTAIIQAIYGNFSAPRAQEIVVNRGSVIELLRCDDLGKLISIISQDIFCIVRSIASFRLTGASRDYIILGSDSGNLVILNYNAEKHCFERIHCEPFGKSGVRRVIAGEYLGVDPRGRALMIGAIERQKFVYVLNRDNAANLIISSPLEAHKSYNVCYSLIGVDVGFENPLFASLENYYEKVFHTNPEDLKPCKNFDRLDNNDKITNQNYSENNNLVDELNTNDLIINKGLSFWEMDLGLNHVIRKATMPLDSTAHLLIPVPGGGGADGPSGVLVCCENYIVYKKIDHDDVYCAIPRRLEMGQDKGLMIISYAVHRMKHFFFILIQSEFGDIYKVELSHDDGIVKEIECRYFDTVPPANSLCVLKSGYLFVACEFGNHLFYQFTGIGNELNDPLCTSAHPHSKDAIMAFKPRILRNLILSDELYSLSPITDLKILDILNEGSPQIYTLCGRGPRSSLRILQFGIGIEEMADNELPGKPKAVWTVKEKVADVNDGYIIVAFEGSTLVLSIGDTVEEVTETLFLTTVTSLHVALLFDDSFVQIHENGIRHIVGKRVNEWKVPTGKRIRTGCSNDRQIIISLSGGEIIQFEVDESHALNEVSERNINVEITCMAVQPIQENRIRSSFVVVGGLDNIVRILSLDRDKNLRQLSTILLPNNSTAESVCLMETLELGLSPSSSTLFLCIGLNTGIILRSIVDPITGQLNDQRSRFLGIRAVNLRLVKLCNSPAMLALSERAWMCYIYQGKYTCIPLNYDTLEYASSFCSEQCPDGFVAISGNSLRIFRCQRLGEVFSQQIFQLSYTPRQFVILPPDNRNQLGNVTDQRDKSDKRSPPMLAIIEADHCAYDENTKNQIKDALKGIKLNLDDENEAESINSFDKKDGTMEEEELSEEQIGTFKAGPGKWGSCIRIFNPVLFTTVEKVSLDVDEAALSCHECCLDDLRCFVVGTTVNMHLIPLKVQKAYIKVYNYDEDYKLTLLHSTSVDDWPRCFATLNGKLLAAVGKHLRLYSLGKKKLLKKCEYMNLPEGIVWMNVVGDRIFVGDIRESIHILKYREEQNFFYVLCDDVCPRWICDAENLDYHTVIASDKFDSITVLRAPSEAIQDEIDDSVVFRSKGDTIYQTGKSIKLETMAEYHLGDIVTKLLKSKLNSAGIGCVVYSTIMGSIGTFSPFSSNEERDFFHHLEMAMRKEMVSLSGRDHIMYRSYYHPVKNVIDGNLCEEFVTISIETQNRIAQVLDRTPPDIIKRLEDIRNRIL